MKWLPIPVAAASFLMISTAAFGYALLSPARRWFWADLPRTVNVDLRGVPSIGGGDPDHGVTAAVQAVNAWSADGLMVTAGAPGPVAYAQGDGISDVVFGDPLGICTGTCIASTLTGYYSATETGTCGGLVVSRITDADVSFNLDFDFTTPAQGSCDNEIYLDAVVSHEVGHVLGLAHSSDTTALMYPKIAACDDKPLARDDYLGRNALYTCYLIEGGAPTGGGTCSAQGAICSSGGECCSGSCRGARGRKTCR